MSVLSGHSNQSQNDPLKMSCCYEPKGNNKGKVKLKGLKPRASNRTANPGQLPVRLYLS